MITDLKSAFEAVDAAGDKLLADSSGQEYRNALCEAADFLLAHLRGIHEALEDCVFLDKHGCVQSFDEDALSSLITRFRNEFAEFNEPTP